MVIIKLGKYPQKTCAPKTIEWRVLEVKGNEALLISRYGLICKPYHRFNMDISWEDCDLRKWLNEDFLNEAFTPEERQRIRLSDVANDEKPEFYATSGGNNTQDRIFCLSNAEARRYFKNNRERTCRATALAREKGLRTLYSGCFWWLRSPGFCQNEASSVYADGSMFPSGFVVRDTRVTVRPAMWVNM